jgi:NAD(P)-dependent dehydrogenase (short-subunit alcohol dehydrogenase family)
VGSRTHRRLDGVRTVVTGAASGIGRATAETFHREGAHVVLVDVDGNRLAALVSGLDERASACVTDLGDPAGLRAVLEHVLSTVGDVEVLVNNAGISSKTQFRDVDEGEWKHLFDVNVLGAVALGTTLGEAMAARGSGCVLNVSSISGLGGGAGQSVYGITKGALLGFTRELATALGSHGVRVNAVLPGVIDTPMVRRDISRTGDPNGIALADWIRRTVPLARIGNADEVASVLAFLASPDGAPINGAFIPVEGGLLSA